MKKISKVLLVLMMLISVIVINNYQIHADDSNLKIYSFYWGGGNKNATYERDYVVIYNDGEDAINLDGYSLQYKNGTTHRVANLSGTVGAKNIYTLAGNKGKSGGEPIPSNYNVKVVEDRFNIHTNGSSLLALVKGQDKIVDGNDSNIISKYEFRQPSKTNSDAVIVESGEVIAANDPKTYTPLSSKPVSPNQPDIDDSKAISVSEAIKANPNDQVSVNGTVLTPLSGGFGGKKGFYLFDNSGDVIYVFNELNKAINPGSQVVVNGNIAEYNSLNQISNVTDILTGSSPHQYQPAVTQISALSSLNHAKIVRLENLVVTDFGTSDKYGNETWQLKDANNQIISLRLDSRVTSENEISELKSAIKKDGIINLEAIATKFKNNNQLQLFSKDKVEIVKAGSSETNNQAYQAKNIGEVQSNFHYSPLMNKNVTLKEVVVTFKASKNIFFIQDINPDNDQQTSDGLLVKTKFVNEVNVGDKLTITGLVKEDSNTGYRDDSKNYLPITMLEVSKNSDVIKTGVAPLPEPVIVSTLPVPMADEAGLAWYKYRKDGVTLNNKGKYDATKYRIDYLESLEGMLIKYEKPIVVAPQAYGDVYVVANSNASKLSNGLLHMSEEGRSPYLLQLHLAKFNNLKNDTSLITKPKDYFNNDIVGVLNYGYGNYYLQTNIEQLKVQNNINKTENNLNYINDGELQPEITTLTKNDSQLSIASYNVENFSTKTEASKVKRIAESIVMDLKKPDILALIEVQDNDGADDSGITDAKLSAQKLIEAIRQLDNSLDYKYVDIAPENNQDGGQPGGNIRVGYLYNSKRVTFNANPGTTSLAAEYRNNKLNANPVRINPTNPAFVDTRKSLVAQFEFNNESILVINNHLSSKRGDQPLTGKYQPPVFESEPNRHLQSQAVADFIKDVLAKNPDQKIVAVGDFNDYEWTKTIKNVENAGMLNMVANHDFNDRFSYSYQGSAQSLDQMLISKNLENKYHFDMVHVNSLFMKEHGRASDHDPLLIVLDMENKQPQPDNPPQPQPQPNPAVLPDIDITRDEFVYSIVNDVDVYYPAKAFSDRVDLIVKKLLNHKYPSNWNVYDIHFELNGVIVNPSERVLVSLPLNNNFSNYVEVLYVDNNGNLVLLPIEKIENNRVYFYTTTFGTICLRNKTLPSTGTK